ncbi:putative adipose-regulatory protein-domain-containing protein [Phyllosticta citriasiana]|uniref:putative adipose-regulatory protein-domain-containing protein n=1 Tax=Phyllosticta citriasiana TaxID=595635 RepID=UPI0030FD24A4
MTSSGSSEDEDEYEYQKGALTIAKEKLLQPFHLALSPPARRAYLTTTLTLITSTFLLVTALLAYGLFYYAYIPTRGFSIPVHLQFNPAPGGPAHPSQHDETYNYYPGQLTYHPFGTAHLRAGPSGDGSHRLVSQQAYDVRVELRMPRTRRNREAGNFMVEVELFGPVRPPLDDGSRAQQQQQQQAQSAGLGRGGPGARTNPGWSMVPSARSAPAVEGRDVLARERRPAILTYYSPPVEHVIKALELPMYLVGWRREAETLEVPMMEAVRFERGWRNLPEVVRVEVQAVERVQVYGCTVVFEARLQGLRYIMYNYRIISVVVFSLIFWAFEMIFMLIAYFALSHYFSPSSATEQSPEVKKEEEEEAEDAQGDTTGVKKEEDDDDETATATTDAPDLSDTPRTFPSYGRQPTLRYTSPRVKSEDDGAEGSTTATAAAAGPSSSTPRRLSDIPPLAQTAQEADDEDEDKDNDVFIDPAGRFFERDSGLGTSMESSAGGGVERRESIRRRLSGRFGGGGGGGGGGGS